MSDIAVLGLRVDASGAIVATESLGAALNNLGGSATRAENTLGKMAAKLATIGVSLAGVVSAVQQAQAFEKQMAMIATVTDASTASITVFGEQVKDLFARLPVGSIEELTKGLYDIISAGLPAADAMNILEVSAKAAIAGLTSTATAVDGITTVLAAFKSEGLSAGQVSDALFQAVNVGKITFEQLAGSIGKTAPVAAAYNVKLNDLLASTAQLTVNGLSAEESFTAIRSAIANIINPTAQFAKQFPELAKEFNAAKLQGVGFTQFLIDFSKASGGSKDALNALFTDIQGKVGVLSLLSDGGQGAADKLRILNDSTGAAQTAFEKLNGTSASFNQALKNQFTKALLDLGQVALPLVNTGLELAISFVNLLKTNLPAVVGLVTAIGTGFVAWSIAARAAATWTAVLSAAQTVQAFLSLAKMVRSTADAMALLSMVGKGAAGAVAAIVAVGAGYAAYKLTLNEVEKAQKKFADELERTAGLGKTGTPAAPTTPTGTPGTTLSPEEVAKAQEVTTAAAERVRLAEQALDLSRKIGAEEALLAVTQKATNDRIKARNELSGANLRVTLAAIDAEERLAKQQVNESRGREQTRENQQRLLQAKQEYDLIGLTGIALAKARLENERTNKLLEARRTLTGDELDARERVIQREYELGVAGAEYNQILDNRKAKQEALDRQAQRIMQDQKQATENFERQFLSTLSGGIEGVLKNGLKGFEDFAASVKNLFIKMFADIAAANAMKKLTTSLGAVIPGSQYDLKNVANANYGTGGSSLAGGAAAGIGGFSVGYGVGSMTSNKTVGVVGGAAAGAATGAVIGSVLPGIGTAVGAIIGGLTGAIGGFLGASKNATQELIAQKAAQKSLNEAMAALRASFANDPIGAAIAQTKVQFEQLREQTEKAFSGKKNEAERNRILAELNVLEAQRIELIKQEYAEGQRRLQQDLEVRRLRATGRTAEADALALAEAQAREYADAIKAGADATTLAAMKETQLAEARRAAAEAAEGERRRIFDLTNGAQAFTDPRGASIQREIEEGNRRLWDAINRGASEAEQAAIRFYNAAALANAEAQRMENDRRTGEGLIVRGLTATGNTRAAEDYALQASQRQEMADAIRDGMSATNIALLEFVQFAEREALATRRAIEDGTKAIQQAAKDEVAAVDLMIAATKEVARQQIAALDEQIKTTQQMNTMTQRRYDEQIEAIREQSKAQIDRIDAQIAATRQSLDVQKSQLKTLEESVGVNERVVTALQAFTDSVKLGELSTLSPEAQLAEARRQFEAMASAALGGDATAAAGLPEAARTLLQASRSFNASSPGYVGDFERVNAVVDAVKAQFGATLPIDKQQLEALKRQVAASEASLDALQRQKDAIQKAAERQIAVLQDLKTQAAEAAQKTIDKLTAQKDEINANTEATVSKLEATRQAILDSAQRQIDQLIADENAKLQTRIRENKFYDQFQAFADGARTFFGDATGTALDLNFKPVPITAENNPQLAATQATNTELKAMNTALTQKLEAVSERLERLVSVSVATSGDEVEATNGVRRAVQDLAAETRNAAQAAAARTSTTTTTRR